MQSGGQALKRSIHMARERKGIPSDMQLARAAGISYDTLMNWYSGRTVPRPAELKKVADATGTTLVALMDAYEGRDPEPPTLVEAIRELVAEMRLSRAQQDEATVAMLHALGAMAAQLPSPQGTRQSSARGARAGTRQASPAG